MLSWVGPQPQHTAAPQAKETNVYLQYIIDHYEQLPETTVFMHAHRWVRCDVAAVVSLEPLDSGGSASTAGLCILPRRKSWHMHDKVQLLRRLRWGEVGFANLRHKGYEVWHQPQRLMSEKVETLVSTLVQLLCRGCCHKPSAQSLALNAGVGLW